jgi:hypothetical protein
VQLDRLLVYKNPQMLSFQGIDEKTYIGRVSAGIADKNMPSSADVTFGQFQPPDIWRPTVSEGRDPQVVNQFRMEHITIPAYRDTTFVTTERNASGGEPDAGLTGGHGFQDQRCHPKTAFGKPVPVLLSSAVAGGYAVCGRGPL